MQKVSDNSRAGLSVIEVVISTLLVGLVLVGSMRCLGGALRGQSSTSDSARALLLAQQLSAEIINEAYQDEGTPVFGPETGEVTGDRSLFDDVDDYHLWTAAPPEGRDGTALPNLPGWQRDVTVEYVNPANPGTPEVSDLGVKRITVSIRLNGNLLVQQVVLRSDMYTMP